MKNNNAEPHLTSDQQTRRDMIVIDAFSSDSIPAHLVTREALSLLYDG